MQAAQQSQPKLGGEEGELFPMLASLARYQQDPLSLCDTLKKPDTPTGEEFCS